MIVRAHSHSQRRYANAAIVRFEPGAKRFLRAGAHVTVYAYRLVDARSWDAARLSSGALATRSRPDRQTHTLTFAAEAERAYSAPDRGSPP